jgi:hypothetical protein
MSTENELRRAVKEISDALVWKNLRSAIWSHMETDRWWCTRLALCDSMTAKNVCTARFFVNSYMNQQKYG